MMTEPVVRLREAIQAERHGRQLVAAPRVKEQRPSLPARPTFISRQRIGVTVSANEQQLDRWSGAAEARGWSFARLVREALDALVG